MSSLEAFLALGLCPCSCHTEDISKNQGKGCASCREVMCKHERLVAFLKDEDNAKFALRYLCFQPGKEPMFGEFENMKAAVDHYTAHLKPGEQAYVVFDTGQFIEGRDEVSSRRGVGKEQGAGV